MFKFNDVKFYHLFFIQKISMFNSVTPLDKPAHQNLVHCALIGQINKDFF